MLARWQCEKLDQVIDPGRMQKEKTRRKWCAKRGYSALLYSAIGAVPCCRDRDAYVENGLWLRIMLLWLCCIVAKILGQDHSSVSLSRRWILKIMTSRPIVTMSSNAKLNQPRTMADVPTPDFMLPLPMSWATCAAATDAVCCHSTDTRTKTEAMKTSARADCETGREGKGFTSTSEPLRSRSSCQPGKEARRRKQRKAKMIAMILFKRS
jgi:hypothetical protein